MNKLRRDIAKAMRSFRLHSGMTQAVFGLVFEVTSQTVSNWENGRAKPSTLTWHTALQIGESGRKYPAEMKVLVKAIQEWPIRQRPSVVACMVLLNGLSAVPWRKNK